jgi:hypothetical protein
MSPLPFITYRSLTVAALFSIAIPCPLYPKNIIFLILGQDGMYLNVRLVVVKWLNNESV